MIARITNSIEIIKVWCQMKENLELSLQSIVILKDIFDEIKVSKDKVSPYTLWIGMGILAWFLVGGKYYSHTWFLYNTGLLYQG